MYILYLGILNDENTISCSSIFWNQKSILGYMTIFASHCDNKHPFSRKSEMMIKFGFHSQGLKKLQEGLGNIMTYLTTP